MGPSLLGTGGSHEKRHKVTVIGSGNWGSTISKIVAENTKEHPELFEEAVHMWVYEEDVTVPSNSPLRAQVGDQPQKLTSIINTYHENVKYLPNIKLPLNVIANPSLKDAVKDSSILVFNLPHQFIHRVITEIKDAIVPFARGISCIKGVDVNDDGIKLFSEVIGDGLGIYCGALSGANVASEIAEEEWCATNIAYDPPPVDSSRNPTPRSTTPVQGNSPRTTSSNLNLTPLVDDLQHTDAKGRKSKTKLVPVPQEFPPLDHSTFQALFQRDYFEVSMVSDVAGVSLAGALKNIVALAAGITVGTGLHSNAKAEIVVRGVNEMQRFGREFFAETVKNETFLNQNAGYGDVMTSCDSGRNYKCSKMAAEENVAILEIERRELNGQKLQGTSTAQEVYSFLKAQGSGKEKEYPLFTAVRDVVEGNLQYGDFVKATRPWSG